MQLSNDQLKKLLLENQLATEEDLRQAEMTQSQTGISLHDAVVQQDIVTDEECGRLIADSLHISFVSLTKFFVQNDILQIIPEVVARAQKIIAFLKDKDGLHVAMADPTDIQLRSFIEKKAGMPVMAYYATDRDIANAFMLYRKDVKTAFADIIAEHVTQASGRVIAEPSIIKIVDTIISYAYENRASDIHIEPLEEHAIIRFRIDGILHDIVQLPTEVHPQVVTRIKVLSKLRTDEHQAAQDGKMQQMIDKEKLDMRVSITPITRGEKIVLRLLSERARQFSLADLGCGKEDLVKINAAYDKPYGMILATGPTGSGKTTTMYAALKVLNRREVNIMTIEDPVEYDIAGVNQIQVNTKTNLTFSAGLRSIVRQDPDIILVGEIRDEETAGIAINSAMTGHLVLSTLHTNDAATALPRLLDMNVEPFLVASTVNIIIGQRLVRKICIKCRVSGEMQVEEMQKHFSNDVLKKHFDMESEIRTYHGKGCPVCHSTGYEGRIGIFEVLVMDDEVRQAITEQKDANFIQHLAVKNGMTTMIDDGIEKIKQGFTTIEEVLRVTKE